MKAETQIKEILKEMWADMDLSKVHGIYQRAHMVVESDPELSECDPMMLPAIMAEWSRDVCQDMLKIHPEKEQEAALFDIDATIELLKERRRQLVVLFDAEENQRMAENM